MNDDDDIYFSLFVQDMQKGANAFFEAWPEPDPMACQAPAYSTSLAPEQDLGRCDVVTGDR